jgi:hypothetical protein
MTIAMGFVPNNLTDSTGGTPTATLTSAVITDSTGGTPATTFAAIAAGASYAQGDMTAVKNAISQIAASLNNLTNCVASLAARVNTLLILQRG